MGINYDGLLKFYRKEDIKDDFTRMSRVSSTAIAKLSKNETVSMKIIEYCRLLKCQPGIL